MRILNLLIFTLSILGSSSALSAQLPLRFMTFNIRYESSGDGLNAWAYRKDRMIAQIERQMPAVLGVQEALNGQVKDLAGALHSYKQIGGGRDDGKQAGEYSALYIDTTLLQVFQTGTFWLSQTPEKPGSMGWDAACPRIVTYARCKERLTDKFFFVFNSHFDHIGTEARRNSALLLLSKIKEIAADSPTVVMGDFNATPDQEPIQILLNSQGAILENTSQNKGALHEGPLSTFNGFSMSNWKNQPIDYVFTSSGFTTIRHLTLTEIWDTNLFSSDHFPVIVDLNLP